MRTIGLDLGTKTIGVAVSDPLGWTAQGVKTIQRIGLKKDIEEIKNIINEYSVSKIVLGMPKNMNGTVGEAGERSLAFAEALKNKTGLEVILQDERLTTAAAQRTLIEADMSRKKRKKVVDTVAATYILQTYLDRVSKL
ncbi:Holliday junction resolvase RuvX [Clostridium cylindrosporum]|uniref:Putative pre-16S rRNA nuclease n=1 Tax=Clostridium cylindrosporum DSM 605 TaxID=1121307 RepID=A0A0J8D620_CLOCY|nr:Holliday junction resolvase RuvX [Clostridium cylindrosporum]KMT21302.1 putative holliday junction resolvase [Clostridium cylindrosporum DSM 605]